MRVAIVGGGVAGALLAWRITEATSRIALDVYSAPAPGDASAVSGGLVRGFETSPEACHLAAASLAELRADPWLREAAGYREIGSVYLLPPGSDPSAPVRVVEDLLPGSATILTGMHTGSTPAEGYPLAAGVVAVAERYAGFLSPHRMRTAVLARLDDLVRAIPVRGLEAGPAVRLADGSRHGYEAVVVAAGAWTPALLAASGLAAEGLRTKQIQYGVYPGGRPGLGAFVDEGSGLYGRPAGAGRFLLGLPGDRWDVDPAALTVDAGLAGRVGEPARELLGAERPLRTSCAADCYHERPGLVMRDAAPGVFTFTGGSGGAAKTVLAASRVAAAALIR